MIGRTNALQASGGEVVTESDVNFYDYNGTLVKGYTIAQAQALTALPDAPTHDGLTFQEWNYTLSEVNATTSELNIGATYCTTSGLTEIDITLTKVTGFEVTFQNLTGMTSIDWGDGTTDALLTHNYVVGGDYTIKIAGLRALSNFDFGASTHKNAIDAFTAVRLASGVASIGNSCFINCYSLTSITIPSSVTGIGSFAFNNCYSLTSISIPNSVTSIGDYAFNNCYSLTSITISSSITSTSTHTFRYCYSLTSITIPSGVTIINNYAFNGCYCVKEYDFSNHTVIPTLSNTNAFDNINSICKIKVPTALYADWIVATNWSTYADYIEAV